MPVKTEVVGYVKARKHNFWGVFCLLFLLACLLLLGFFVFLLAWVFCCCFCFLLAWFLFVLVFGFPWLTACSSGSVLQGSVVYGDRLESLFTSL